MVALTNQKNSMKNLFLLICTFITCTIIAQKNTPVATIKWETYTDTVNKFSFTYPNNWTIRIAGPNEKAKVFVRSPKEGDDDIFTENINIQTKFTNEKVDMKALQLALEVALQKQKGFLLKESEIIKTNGVDACYFDYSVLKTVNETEQTINMVQQLFVKNSKLYTITYTAIANAKNDYYATAVKIIKNFAIIK